MPYQYSSDMRGERTLQFYRNLNLEACIWEFENWFSMSELQQACGGEITTDGQVYFWLFKLQLNFSFLGFEHGPLVCDTSNPTLRLVHLPLANSNPVASL